MDLALLLVRLIGIGFAAHGAQKLFGWFGGHGLAGTGGFFEQIGFRPGHIFAAAAGFSEIAGGLLVALGLLGPIGPMFMIAVMTTAALSVHAPNGFFAQNNGYELPLVYGGLALVLAFAGFGVYSLDAALGLSSLWTPAISWIAVGLGILGGLGNVAMRRKAATSQPAGN
ncbi:MAG TPA: DoxX family protein [Candidatus Baltobacteraceae bacterium]|nr:DoxX family protein [Candidatus Baltobacteraceae bacterium]